MRDLRSFFFEFGARGRTRTGTLEEKKILSLPCLPFHHSGIGCVNSN